ncbi:auxin-responsive protein IAA25-like isoform X2 [Magnolia sinica]|uniref:auxin-responsive protein IAA25-like isoform X2 n=1 Tax=Magnolia sinica TaxID=86752 RepID=UPI0026598959|nr:auxin-responsive protein IAA25-like isoform X2 [Magnolia sinica]
MRTPLLETPTKEEEEKEDKEKMKTASGFQNHLGPKTRETELRLGFSSNGFEDMGSVEDGSQKLSGFVMKQRNSGFGAKRWFSETEGGFSNPWKQEKVVYDQTHQQRRIDSSPAPRAPPVVGWPPVRAFRKNLASQPKPGEMESKAAAAATSAEAPKAVEESMFVKVNMEGYAVGRKINLKAHESYESLSRALQKMFNNFFSINYFKKKEQGEEDELVNSDHVLIYEDNEGDRMLVGDVPWDGWKSSSERSAVSRFQTLHCNH